MDYDEWTPLGRGDPLKNNPTFDYVPPVLDRVQYWLDSHTTESSAKRDVLVLGVTAKKTSPKIPEQFLKFVDGPKFSKSNQEAPFRNDFTGSSGAEPPKLVRTTSFRNGPPVDYRNQNRIQSVPASYYPSTYYKSKPYTMMLPPPLLQKDKIVSFAEPTQQFSTQTEEGPVLREPSQFYAIPSNNYNNQYSAAPPSKSHSQSKAVVSQVETIKSVQASSTSQPTKPRHEATAATTPSVSFEKSNLIYQSTQTVSGSWPAGSGPAPTPSTASDANRAAWQAHDRPRDRYEVDHHVAAGSSHHEVVVEQNANIIVDAESNENEEVVVGQKESSPADPLRESDSDHEGARAPLDLTGPESSSERTAEKMHIVLANSSGAAEEQSSRKEPVAVVMPSNYSEKTPNSDSVATPEPETTVSDTSTTLEPEAQKSHRPEPVRGSPAAPLEEPQQQPSSQFAAMLPNRAMSSHRQHSQSAPESGPRQPAVPPHSFGFPQPPLQAMMHPQSRPNHAMMQFLGGMRPGAGFRLPPGSLPMFPPMTHMHAPPPITKQIHHAMLPPSVDRHRPPEFSMMFTESPAASALTGQLVDVGAETKDQAPPSPRTTPLLPTVAPTDRPVAEGVVPEKNSLLGTVANKDREEDAWGRTSTTTSRPPTSTSPRITTVQSLTTDPIFSHYKQPAKPIRGPMYLIIQGHSKVKTYKPTVTKHGVPVAKNEIAEAAADRQLSKFEQFVKENTRSGDASVAAAEKRKAEEKARAEKVAQARQNSLMSLLESGLGSFAVSSPQSSSSTPSSSATTASEEEHQPNSVTTIEINGN